jgi:hypothetical protein
VHLKSCVHAKAPVGVGGFERGEILSGGWRVARVGTQASGVVQSIMTFTLFYDPKGDEDRSFVERLHELVAVQNGHNLIKLEKHAMHERQRSLRSNRHRNRISHDTPLSSADASSVTTRPRRRSISDGRTRFEYARLFVGEAALAGEFVRTIFDFAALVSAEGYSVLIALLFFAFACHQWMMSRSEIVISRFFSVVSSIAHQTSVAETPTKKKYFFSVDGPHPAASWRRRFSTKQAQDKDEKAMDMESHDDRHREHGSSSSSSSSSRGRCGCGEKTKETRRTNSTACVFSMWAHLLLAAVADAARAPQARACVPPTVRVNVASRARKSVQ